MISRIVSSIFCVILFPPLYAQNSLQQSLDKQFPVGSQTLCLSYTEDFGELNHGFKPWSIEKYSAKGHIQLHDSFFIREDTLHINSEEVSSNLHLFGDKLSIIDYGKASYSPVTRDLVREYLLKTLRYYPIYLLKHLRDRSSKKKNLREDNDYIIYKDFIDETSIEFYVRKSDYLIEKIYTRYSDVDGFGNSLGDMQDIYSYFDYSKQGEVYFPKRIEINRFNGKIQDQVEISQATLSNEQLAITNDTVQLKNEEPTPSFISTTKYSDHIYLLDIEKDKTVTLLVEFDNFFVAIEAPKSSRNGELIITEAKKLDPKKPIRYFVAGHFHPHYMGGLRAFVHKGATVLSIADNYEYIAELVSNSHTITIDSLELERQPLKFETIDKNVPYTLSDGSYEMQIIFIGDKSNHTYDYLVFYFPQERMLYQGDLLFIPEKGRVKKLSKREMSCYNVIKDYNLDVETILQAWPVNDLGVKWKIPFKELDEIIKDTRSF